jgi:hypothetical protein
MILNYRNLLKKTMRKKRLKKKEKKNEIHKWQWKKIMTTKKKNWQKL